MSEELVGIDINKGDETRPFYRSRLVVQEYKRQADWSFLTATTPLEALRSLLICATTDELPNEVGQPMAWTGKVARLLRSMYGCRDAGVSWEFAICEV